MELEQRFRRTWQTVCDSDADTEYAAIVAAYGERHRAYHTLDHVRDCLTELDRWPELAMQPLAVELAIWFHDLVYRPLATNNEAASAARAAERLQHGHGDQTLVEQVAELILATSHSFSPQDRDQQLIIDIDLAVLGREPERYELYQAQIRREYRWLPGPFYRRRRAALLRSFLARPAIYSSAELYQRYEQQARDNLARALAQLEGAVVGDD